MCGEGYKRVGDDLIYTHRVYNVIQDDGPIHFQSLDNRELMISMDEIITPDTVKVVEGEGMPIYNPTDWRTIQKGDLFIRFDIQFRREDQRAFLTEEQKERVAAILQ